MCPLLGPVLIGNRLLFFFFCCSHLRNYWSKQGRQYVPLSCLYYLDVYGGITAQKLGRLKVRLYLGLLTNLQEFLRSRSRCLPSTTASSPSRRQWSASAPETKGINGSFKTKRQWQKAPRQSAWRRINRDTKPNGIRAFMLCRYAECRSAWRAAPALPCCLECQRGKYPCTVDLLFDWFGLVCFAKKQKLSIVIQLIPNQSNRRSMVQWYFPL